MADKKTKMQQMSGEVFTVGAREVQTEVSKNAETGKVQRNKTRSITPTTLEKLLIHPTNPTHDPAVEEINVFLTAET